MIKQTFKTIALSTLIFLSACFITLPNLAYAQSGGGCDLCSVKRAVEKVGDKVDTLTDEIIQITKNVAKSISELLYEPNPYAAGTEAANKTAVGTLPIIEQGVKEEGNANVCEMLVGNVNTNNLTKKGLGLCKDIKDETTSSILNKYADVCGTDYPSACEKDTSIFSRDHEEDSNENASFNASTLLNNLTYSKKQSASAKNFIAFVSSLALPLRGLDPDTLQNMDPESEAAQAYRVAVRNYIAQQSLGLNNFNYVYQQHQVTESEKENGKDKSIAKLAGIEVKKKNNKKEISAAELDQEMATRRLNDSDWYKAMSTASPTTLQRETLFLLAEMRYELYKQRQLQQRMMLAMSALQMQFIQQQKRLQLDTLRNNLTETSSQPSG